ncbi:hypothetical protein NDI56_03390 [Haloarcula sp. S1CR25-12]|uniref:Uncharacterized protein n=1 Tax=Haloarcula saliterrae TaxID=2950534 RepID=A0ABU2F859_9EURY|nr:hypothetical protein [Haloarcula sp. S1CR25-12]MDS0258452.1 hypothetical protein [Haloarcula sp. S1CR25-12]
MNVPESALESHLEAALQAADDDEARYHIREALQLRIVEQTAPGDSH